MTFGESLKYEFDQILKLSEKVFPIVAPEEAKTPYLVYKRGKVEVAKTLSGASNKSQAKYGLSLVTSTYSEKEEIEQSLSEKVMAFLFRNIGLNGPYIQNISFNLQNEFYDPETSFLVSEIQIDADY